ncbi:MAG: acetyl-CoA carboxylase carboxyltransferase subunit alpha [Calditrichaeota bacterium]|nr:acetyl-CoA carboxylase carboxyltransferase subunit alpha [Calditrichota bacterium]
MPKIILDFEKPIAELEKKIEDMRDYSVASNVDLQEDISRLQKKAEKLRKDIYSNLTRWQRVQIARHPERPYTLDFINLICSEFTELHGDRLFADDNAMVAGIGVIDDFSCVIIGQQKGRDTKTNLFRNFGMANPEGYRKALRLMKMAERFNKPIITFIDTPGAYPGLGAEERGQAEAIARNLFEMSHLKVPIINVVIGEGASGGALGIGVGDRLLMLENAWYSVISPEGCAAILWRDNAKAPEAAEAMKLSATDLKELKVIDEVINEPSGGAHLDHKKTAENVKSHILKDLKDLLKIDKAELVRQRIDKFSKIGFWEN